MATYERPALHLLLPRQPRALWSGAAYRFSSSARTFDPIAPIPRLAVLMHHRHDDHPLSSDDVDEGIGETCLKEQAPSPWLDLWRAQGLLGKNLSQAVKLGQKARSDGNRGFLGIPAPRATQLVRCLGVQGHAHDSTPSGRGLIGQLLRPQLALELIRVDELRLSGIDSCDALVDLVAPRLG